MQYFKAIIFQLKIKKNLNANQQNFLKSVLK